MFYSFDITVPANTLAAAPLKQRLELVPGIITRVEVIFPAGCVGLVHLKLFRGANQAWPSNPEGDFNGNGHPIFWSESFPLDDAPFEFTAVLWNQDDTYPHTVSMRFEVGRFPEPLQRALERQQRAQAITTLEIEV